MNRKKLAQAYINEVLLENPDIFTIKGGVLGFYSSLQDIFLKDAQSVMRNVAKEVLERRKNNVIPTR